MNNIKYEINDLKEYIETIHSIKSTSPIDLYYRGQSNEAYELIPSIGHKICKDSDKTYLLIERDLIKEALFKYPKVFGKYDSHIDLLTQLQHYNVPTRLMDVTSNPLVALYFACASNSGINGEVFAFKMNAIDTYDNEIVDPLASVGSLNMSYPVKFEDHLKRCGIELSNSANKHTTNYERIIAYSRFPVLLRQKTAFEQQKAQSGYYLLFSNKLENINPNNHEFESSNNEYYFADAIEPIDKKNEQIVILKIPSASKNKILSQLKTVNIDESTLFPEDIDRGCRMMVKDLSDYYLSQD